MTTLAAIGGLLPLALGIGPGAEMEKPLAIAVIGGLSTATIFTLVVIPVLYASFIGESPGASAARAGAASNATPCSSLALVAGRDAARSRRPRHATAQPPRGAYRVGARRRRAAARADRLAGLALDARAARRVAPRPTSRGARGRARERGGAGRGARRARARR